MSAELNGRQFVNSGFNGLTKRELFAAMAMQGVLARPYPAGVIEMAQAPAVALKLADALLAALDE